MSILSSIGHFFKKLWDAIRKVLAIILIIIAVILIVWSAIVTGGATLTLLGFVLTTTQAFMIGVCCVVGAFLIDSETSKEVVGKVGEAVSGAAGAVAGVVGNVVGSTAAALLRNPYVIAAVCAVGAYFLLRSPAADTGEVSPTSGKMAVDEGEEQVVVGTTGALAGTASVGDFIDV